MNELLAQGAGNKGQVEPPPHDIFQELHFSWQGCAAGAKPRAWPRRHGHALHSRSSLVACLARVLDGGLGAWLPRVVALGAAPLGAGRLALRPFTGGPPLPVL